MADRGAPLVAPGFCDGGAIDRRRFLYVSRQADQLVDAGLAEGQDVHIFGTRMAGKTSLAARARDAIRAQGGASVIVDLTEIADSHTAEELAVRLCRLVALEAGLDRQTTAAWPDEAAGLPMAEVLREFLAPSVALAPDGRLVVFLDELDILTTSRLGAEFLAALRSLQQQRIETAALQGLRLCLVGVRPVDDLAYESQLPTTVFGNHIWLDDFVIDDATVSEVARGFTGAQAGSAESLARRTLEYSGGYPRACMWLCNRLAESGLPYTPDINRRLRSLVGTDRSLPEFLGRCEGYLDSFARLPPFSGSPDARRATVEALWQYQDLLVHHEQPFDRTDPAHRLLRWSGLAVAVDDLPDTATVLRPRGEVTEEFLDDDWAKRMRLRLEQSTVSIRPEATGVGEKPKGRICILTTGGVIGMVEREGQVVPPGSDEELRAAYADVQDIAQVEWVAAVDPPLDSSNIGPAHWYRIASSIYDRRDRFDGFVVAHGTDTMAYSASAVAFALGENLTFPVVFTGAQATVDVRHGDARANLLRACMVALQPLPEVVVCFGERIFRGVRAQKKDDRGFDAFDSPAWPALGTVNEVVELYTPNIRPISDPAPPIRFRGEFSDRLLFVTQAPGVRAALYEQALDAPEAERPHGIVIQTLGAGHVPATGPYSHEKLIKRAVTLDIPVLLTSQYQLLPQNILRYTPAKSAWLLGAIPMGNLTVPALAAKLSWALGQVGEHVPLGQRRDAVRELIAPEYVGEGQSQLGGAGDQAPSPGTDLRR
jgi:L-asparaginase/Glu-tRNA(Gln) amidotransferase subunit D